ncbi:MAG: hypothetical protein ACON4P_04365 [Candidatus Puniceispirillales bacterium]
MKFVHQALIIIAAMLAAVLQAAPAMAEMIPFDGGVIIYDRGSMDQETYNGTIEGVVFRFDNGEEAYADRLRIETSQQTSPPQYTIDHLEITNFNVFSDGITLAVSSLVLKDTVIAGDTLELEELFADQNLEQAIQQIGRLEIAGLVFDEAEEGNLTVDTVTLEAYPVAIEGIDTIPIQAGELNVKDFIYIPAGASAEGMQDFGFDRVTLNIRSESTVTDKPDRVDSTTRASIDMDGIGTIAMEMDIGMLKGSLLALGQYNEEPENYEDMEFMMMVLSGIFINAAEFSITDEGMLPIMFDAFEKEGGMDRSAAIEDAMSTLALTIGPLAPQTYSAFAPAIERFLASGGTIKLAMNPYGPVPMTSFMSFMAAPDTAMSVLGMTLSQIP